MSAAIWTPFSRSFSRGKQSKLHPPLPPPTPPILLAKSPREKAVGMDAVGDEKQTHISGWNDCQEQDGFRSWHRWVVIRRSTRPDVSFQRIPWQWYCWSRSTSPWGRMICASFHGEPPQTEDQFVGAGWLQQHYVESVEYFKTAQMWLYTDWKQLELFCSDLLFIWFHLFVPSFLKDI